jgi:hypothetical protein
MPHRPHSMARQRAEDETTINETRAFCMRRLPTQPSFPVCGTGHDTNEQLLTGPVLGGVVVAHPGRLEGHRYSCRRRRRYACPRQCRCSGETPLSLARGRRSPPGRREPSSAAEPLSTADRDSSAKRSSSSGLIGEVVRKPRSAEYSTTVPPMAVQMRSTDGLGGVQPVPRDAGVGGQPDPSTSSAACPSASCPRAPPWLRQPWPTTLNAPDAQRPLELSVFEASRREGW